MSPVLRNALASLRYRTARLALSSLAIAAGVAFVTGTLVLGASMNAAYFASFAAGARNVAAAVTPLASGSGRPGSTDAPAVPEAVLARIRSVPGVASAAGRLVGRAALLSDSGQVIRSGQAPGYGINLTADPALRGFTLVSGHVPVSAGQVAVDKATAADEHFRLGQTVRVVDHSGRVRAFRLVGTIDLGVNREFGNSTVTLFQTAAAFSVTGRPGYGLVVTRAAAGVSQATLVSRIRALPGMSGYQVQTGAQLATAEANAAAHFTQQFTTAILVFAITALVVACIVIYNTFTILLTQRGRELALLRCVGATRGQVFGGMLLESLLVGLAASAAGVAAGVGLGWGLQRLFTGFGAGLVSGPIVLTPSTVAIAMITGTAVTVAAAVLPARSATRVAPVEALRGQHEQPEPARIGWLRAAVAIVLAAASLLVTVEGTRHVSGRTGFVEIAAGGCLCFAAVLALGPVLVPPVISFLGWLPGRLAGATIGLAAANARREPRRVAATTAALTIGLALMTVFTVVISSAQASSDQQITQHYPFDYIVTAGRGQLVPPRVISALSASPTLGVVAPFYDQPATVNGIAGTDVGAIGQRGLDTNAKPTMVSGSLTAVGPGIAAIDSGQLALLHVGMGGMVKVSTPDGGTERLRIGAVYTSGHSVLPGVLLSVPDFSAGFRPAGAQEVFINGAPGVSTAVSRAAVGAATASDPELVVSTNADYRAALSSRVNQILALFGALLGLAVLIAVAGIANTLTLSVIERTRESALLRALGLTRGQLRLMLLTEALLMALLAVVLGVGIGTGFGWIMVDAFIRSADGGVISVPFAEIGLFVIISVVAALLAAVLPARRAARVSIVGAMADLG